MDDRTGIRAFCAPFDRRSGVHHNKKAARRRFPPGFCGAAKRCGRAKANAKSRCRKEETDLTSAKKTRQLLMLALAALIWGMAFTAQSVGMDYIGPFTLNGLRSLLGGLVLLPVIRVMDRMAEKNGEEARAPRTPAQRRTLWLGGLCCGLALTAGSSLQQLGMQHTTVGKAGFLTAMYILLVPVLGIFWRRLPGPQVWAGVVLAVLGFYLLCQPEQLGIGRGETLLLLGSLMWSIHILVIDHFSPLVDGVRLSCLQFLVTGVICTGIALVFERPTLAGILSAAVPVLYLGVCSSGMGYTLQIVAQKGLDPTLASLVLSLESVFSVLGGWLILHQALSLRELFGCGLIFAAILLAQLPGKKAKKPDAAGPGKK